MLQGLAYFEKQVHGDVLLAAHLVDVLGRAVHLPRKPRRRAPVAFKLRLDEAAQMELRGCILVLHIVSNLSLPFNPKQ